MVWWQAIQHRRGSQRKEIPRLPVCCHTESSQSQQRSIQDAGSDVVRDQEERTWKCQHWGTATSLDRKPDEVIRKGRVSELWFLYQPMIGLGLRHFRRRPQLPGYSTADPDWTRCDTQTALGFPSAVNPSDAEQPTTPTIFHDVLSPPPDPVSSIPLGLPNWFNLYTQRRPLFSACVSLRLLLSVTCSPKYWRNIIITAINIIIGLLFL